MNHLDEKDIFQGVWPAMLTPVDQKGEVNVASLEKLIELLIAQQLDGLYLLGSSGQGFLFSEKQRREIVELSLKIVNGRIPVMVQVGAMSTDESIRLAKHAAKNGASGISAVGPIYYAASQEMGIMHYRNIAKATDLPFFPYKIGNAPMTESVIDRLLEVENIWGLKLTTTNLLEISDIHNYAGDRLKLFSGADELLCHAGLCGATGAIGTTYNLLGSTCKFVRNAFMVGEVEVGKEFMLRLQKLIHQMLPCIWTFFYKAMLLKHGIDIGLPKAPLQAPALPVNDEQLLVLVNELENFSLDGSVA